MTQSNPSTKRSEIGRISLSDIASSGKRGRLTRVVLLDLLPLGLGVLTTSPLEPDVLVTTVQLFSNVHLHPVVGGDDDLGGTVELQELGHAQTGRTGTEQEDLGSDLGLELVETVDGTRGGLEEGSLLVRDVGVLEDLGLVAVRRERGMVSWPFQTTALERDELTR